MRIGQIADQAGVSVQAVRFYEKKGLIKTPRRSQSGYRNYTAGTVKVVQFIKRSQGAGFTLKELRKMLLLMSSGSAAALNRRRDMEAKIKELDERIASLQSIRAELSECLARCVCSDGITPCPGAEALAQAMRD